MNIKEISDDLEQQFGKPIDVAGENAKFMLSLVEKKEDRKNAKEENVEIPSPDAYATMLMAVTQYQTIPFEELAQKPAIYKSLKYFMNRGLTNYDELESLTKEAMRQHFKGKAKTIIFGIFKIIRAFSTEVSPTELIKFMPFPEHYYAISDGLHNIIRGEHPDEAAAIIHCAIEDGILYSNVGRDLIIKEFDLKKSSFNKYFTQYRVNLQNESPAVARQIEAKLCPLRKTLRMTVGYTVSSDDKPIFYNRELGRKNFLASIVAYCRSIFRH